MIVVDYQWVKKPFHFTVSGDWAIFKHRRQHLKNQTEWGRSLHLNQENDPRFGNISNHHVKSRWCHRISLADFLSLGLTKTTVAENGLHRTIWRRGCQNTSNTDNAALKPVRFLQNKQRHLVVSLHVFQILLWQPRSPLFQLVSVDRIPWNTFHNPAQMVPDKITYSILIKNETSES